MVVVITVSFFLSFLFSLILNFCLSFLTARKVLVELNYPWMSAGFRR